LGSPEHTNQGLASRPRAPSGETRFHRNFHRCRITGAAYCFCEDLFQNSVIFKKDEGYFFMSHGKTSRVLQEPVLKKPYDYTYTSNFRKKQHHYAKIRKNSASGRPRPVISGLVKQGILIPP
jgi:hypothetical protein